MHGAPITGALAVVLLTGAPTAAPPASGSDPARRSAIRQELQVGTEQAAGQTPDDARIRIIRPPVPPSASMRHNFPLLVGLHQDGSSPDSLVGAFEYLARELLMVAALPEGPVPSGTGFTWGSVEEADATVVRAVDRARQMAPIDLGKIALVGFSEGATLACAIGLQRQDLVRGVVAVGPALADAVPREPFGAKRRPRVAILCRRGEPSASGCQETARLLKGLGVSVKLSVLDEKGAREGRLRLVEALEFALSLNRPPTLFR